LKVNINLACEKICEFRGSYSEKFENDGITLYLENVEMSPMFFERAL